MIAARRCWSGCAALTVALGCLAPAAWAKDKPNQSAKSKPLVEVVFCLDTTGSMSGLIEGAKAKIWAISNQIASGKPTPNLKIGLIAYRDKTDAYVTQVTDLSDDLDAIHAKLKTFRAQGGGDTPEHVNQALHDAVHKVKWSTDKKALRIIFLVGDAPPHMDYKDDVKYPDTCKLACEKGIIINTIQCGGDRQCAEHWQKICKLAEGSYAQIEQSGGVVAVATPHDKRLGEINKELSDTTLVFGSRAKQAEGKDKADAGKALPGGASADRAGIAAKSGRIATYDLIDAMKAKEVEFEKLKKEELPPQLRKLTLKEQKDYLEKVEQKRDKLRKEALELDKKRITFIKEKLDKDTKSGKDGFDNRVLEMLRKQAKQKGIDY